MEHFGLNRDLIQFIDQELQFLPFVIGCGQQVGGIDQFPNPMIATVGMGSYGTQGFWWCCAGRFASGFFVQRVCNFAVQRDFGGYACLVFLV